jgi:hypothetical protein
MATLAGLIDHDSQIPENFSISKFPRLVHDQELFGLLDQIQSDGSKRVPPKFFFCGISG